jgi:hypothetical protein
VPFSPFWSDKQNLSDEEIAEWERQQVKLHQDYDHPWLSGLVTFSGFVAAFIGSVVVIFLGVHLAHGKDWLPYALMLGGLVGATCACALCGIRSGSMTGGWPLKIMGS